MERVGPVSVDDQLPPLLSMVIEGLPPLQQSKYVHEAENLLKQYVERYDQNIHDSFNSFCRVGLSVGSYVHPGVISLDRLVAVSLTYAFGYVLDDLFFDTPNDLLLDRYGINSSARESPQRILEYLDHVCAVMGQQKAPSSTMMDTMMSKLGRDMLKLSNPEWFNTFIECLAAYYHTGVATHADIAAGHNSCIQDLESYTDMRADNSGGKWIQLLMEFANNRYVPRNMRSDPYMKKVTLATTIHVGFSNDICSYHKEMLQEASNPRNLITVLMESNGKSFVQAVHEGIDLVNKYGHTILDLESEARNSGLENHFQAIKAVLAGMVYYGCMDKRFRQPDSAFPEQRDMTTSWKALPPHLEDSTI